MIKSSVANLYYVTVRVYYRIVPLFTLTLHLALFQRKLLYYIRYNGIMSHSPSVPVQLLLRHLRNSSYAL